jgi:hypothetical protein
VEGLDGGFSTGPTLFPVVVAALPTRAHIHRNPVAGRGAPMLKDTMTGWDSAALDVTMSSPSLW